MRIHYDAIKKHVPSAKPKRTYLLSRLQEHAQRVLEQENTLYTQSLLRNSSSVAASRISQRLSRFTALISMGSYRRDALRCLRNLHSARCQTMHAYFWAATQRPYRADTTITDHSFRCHWFCVFRSKRFLSTPLSLSQ